MQIITAYLAQWQDRRLVGNFLARRDEYSFRVLYHRHTPALYQLALRLVGWNVHEAEEIVQDTWLRAVEALAEFRWESGFRTWLSGILINRSREFYRARKKERHTIIADELAAEVAVAENFERIDLEQAIAALPNGYRQVLVLHDIEGYTHEEIGRLLEIDAGTSKSQLSHARRAMRASLQAHTAGNTLRRQ
jgi:RNA polymerase sigma-70 factor (ECF subfamily)